MENPAAPRRLYTSALVVVKERQILLAYSANKQAWFPPGGKLQSGESATEALIREVKEELGLQVKPELLGFLGHISAPAYGETDCLMEQDCFLYPLTEAISPQAEITSLRYFDWPTYQREPDQVAGVIQLFRMLHLDSE